VAGDGTRRRSFERMAQQLGVGGPVRFLGFVSDVRRLLASCDVLVLPSRSEGCPNIVLEAMAMGVAVVASDAAATQEVLSPMRDGLLFPTGDVDRLTAAVESLVIEPRLRARLAAQALDRVRRELSAEASARQVVALLRSLLPARAWTGPEQVRRAEGA
jgi:glycosyltransferase involved in cell wall biosynthesis